MYNPLNEGVENCYIVGNVNPKIDVVKDGQTNTWRREESGSTKLHTHLDLQSQYHGLGWMTPQVKVLHIDHILEQILNKLPVNDLLANRLVSNRLNLLANRILRKRILLSISRPYVLYDYVPWHNKRPLQNLTQDLLNSKHFPAKNFPCTKFRLQIQQNYRGVEKDGEHEQCLSRFIDVYGSLIEYLELMIYSHYYVSQKIALTLIDGFLDRMENLKYLKLHAAIPIKWQHSSTVDGRRRRRDESSALRQSDPEYIEINNRGIEILNTKLKVLDCRWHASAKIVEAIISRSPNLIEIKPAPDPFFQQLLEPCNRLHFIKVLTLTADYRGFEPYRNILTAHRERNDMVNLKEIVVDLRFYAKDFELCRNLEREEKMANFLSELLDIFRHTLKIFRWYGVGLCRGMKWPAVMTQLATLHLIFPDVHGSIGVYQFDSDPMDCAVTKMPKLRSICVMSNYINGDLTDLFRTYNLNLNKHPLAPPMRTVTSISINAVKNTPTRLCDLVRIQLMFPNARLDYADALRFSAIPIYDECDACVYSPTHPYRI